MVDVVGARWSRLGHGRRELGGATRDVVDVVRGRHELGRLAQSARLAQRGSLDGSMRLAQRLDGSRRGSPDSLYGSRSCSVPARCLGVVKKG